MIYLDSRYADGTLLKAWDSRATKKQFQLTVFRNWPTYTTNFFLYVWTEMDRLDIVANKYLGDSQLWWQIMDINPELIDPFDIAPGTQVRIPNA